MAKQMFDAKGVAIFDSLNAEFSEVDESVDDEYGSVYAWDMIADKNFKAAAAAVNFIREHGSAVAALLTHEAALVAERDAHREWRRDVCERLGLDCAQGAEWAAEDIWGVLLKEVERGNAIAGERDALAAEVAALVSARDAYRTMLQQTEEDVKALRETLGLFANDAQRWSEVERRFNDSKTSAASMVLEGLGLEPTPYRDFAETVDAARAEAGSHD